MGMESQIGYRGVQSTAAATAAAQMQGTLLPSPLERTRFEPKRVLVHRTLSLHLQHASVHGTAYARAHALLDILCKHIVLMLSTDMPWSVNAHKRDGVNHTPRLQLLAVRTARPRHIVLIYLH